MHTNMNMNAQHGTKKNNKIEEKKDEKNALMKSMVGQLMIIKNCL